MMGVAFFRISRLLVTTCLALSTLLVYGADFQASSFSEMANTKRKVYAAHFLMRATFGPKQTEIDELAQRIGQIGHKAACEEWIDDQLSDYPISSNWETYESDRGRLWPLAKKMLLDMGYRESNLGENTGSQGGVYGQNQYKEYAWWHRSITAKDQLRQRTAWALSQIFVTAEGPGVFGNRTLDSSANPRWLGLAKYYDDVCIQHAFGNYRELLDTMTYHPVMGVWLTTVRNKKSNSRTGAEPDENYAREIMQLFSIGTVELKEDGEKKTDSSGQFIETYDNETITALARVFTGFTYNNNTGGDSIGAGTNLHLPMEMYQQEHDFAEKVAFGGALVIPARTQTDDNARQDISEVHDFLAYEHPNTAPFLCRRLIQRLVMSNPPKSYLRRVSQVFNNNKQSPDQFAKVVKAILLDPVALRSLRFEITQSPPAVKVIRKYPTERTRLREPVLRYTALLRAFSPYPDPSYVTSGSKIAFTTPGGPEGTAGNQYFFIDNDSSGIGYNFAQAPYESESVFNFYSPDYQPPGDLGNYAASSNVANRILHAPEFQIVTPKTQVDIMNEFRTSTIDSDVDAGNIDDVNDNPTNVDINLDLDHFFQDGGMLGPVGTEPTGQQIETFISSLDLLFCAGTMSQGTKDVLVDTCMEELSRYNVDSLNEKEDMVQAIISAVLMSPDCAVIP